MSVETATYIDTLNASLPASGDPKSEGDNHLRLIKQTVKATFPNVTGAVTPTHTELNFVYGVTSAIQTQLDGKAPIASPAFTGTPTVPTASPGTNTTQAASTAFVQATAFSSALPSQTGNAGKFVTTNGTTASWAVAGDVFGPASTTDNTIARYDGGTGKLLQSGSSTLDDSGNLSTPGNVLSTGGLLGYGTGAGGTVTQVTSKATAVTLNKPSGQITTDSSFLNAGASV